jgi:hypothetical protein
MMTKRRGQIESTKTNQQNVEGNENGKEGEGGIQGGSKASGLGIGLADLANKNSCNIWDILMVKHYSLFI